MIPYSTQNHLGPGQTLKAIRFNAHDEFVLTGIDLNDLSALAARMGQGPAIGGDEMRDWQNRLALMIGDAVKVEDQLAADLKWFAS
jgi:hypothetical protein